MVSDWLARKSKHNMTIIRINALNRYLFVFGLAGSNVHLLLGLLSSNLIQAGIFQAVWSWIVLFAYITLHIMEFRELDPLNKRRIVSLYQLLVFIWYLAIAIDYII